MAPPSSVSTSHFARRPTSTIRRPTRPAPKAAGAGWRMARGQSVQTSATTASRTSGRSSRAIVSTSGSSGIGV